MSAEKGNQYAAKPEKDKANKNINIKVTAAEKALYLKKAKNAGQTFTAWIKERLSI